LRADDEKDRQQATTHRMSGSTPPLYRAKLVLDSPAPPNGGPNWALNLPKVMYITSNQSVFGRTDNDKLTQLSTSTGGCRFALLGDLIVTKTTKTYRHIRRYLVFVVSFGRFRIVSVFSFPCFRFLTPIFLVCDVAVAFRRSKIDSSWKEFIVSRIHAKLVCAVVGDLYQFTLIDNDSTNGLCVNKTRVKSQVLRYVARSLHDFVMFPGGM
jgi:hypothetical protein